MRINHLIDHWYQSRKKWIKNKSLSTSALSKEKLHHSEQLFAYNHYVKSVKIWSFFWYRVSLRIQSKCGKIRTRKNSVFGHFSRSESLRKPLTIWRRFLSISYWFNLELRPPCCWPPFDQNRCQITSKFHV